MKGISETRRLNTVDTETLALFDDNLDALYHRDTSNSSVFSSLDDIFNCDRKNEQTQMELENFDKIFMSCMARMEAFESSRTFLSTPVPENTARTMDVQCRLGQNFRQKNDEQWKRPKTFDCRYCPKKFYNRLACHHHQVCHTKEILRCRYCKARVRSISGLRRHNEYFHSAIRKRHVFFDSSSLERSFCSCPKELRIQKI